MVTLACLSGLVLFAYFRYCDPIEANQVQTKDQLVIYMVVRSLGTVRGLPGLFLACLCSGTLSTVSSGINSLSAVTWHDFLHLHFRSQTDKTHALVVVALAIFRPLCYWDGISLRSAGWSSSCSYKHHGNILSGIFNFIYSAYESIREIHLTTLELTNE